MIQIRAKIRDGEEQIQLQCPSCETWGDVDSEQAEGVISCICPKCRAHWTIEIEDGVPMGVRIHDRL